MHPIKKNLRAANWPWYLLSQAESICDSPFCQLLFWATVHFLSMTVLYTYTDKQYYTMSGKGRYQEYLEKKMEGEIQKRGQEQKRRGDLKDLSYILFFPVTLLSLLSFFFCLHFKDDEWHSSGRLLISSMLGRGLDRDCTVLRCYCGGCATPSINYICLEYHLQGAYSETTHGLREQ